MLSIPEFHEKDFPERVLAHGPLLGGNGGCGLCGLSPVRFSNFHLSSVPSPLGTKSARAG